MADCNASPGWPPASIWRSSSHDSSMDESPTLVTRNADMDRSPTSISGDHDINMDGSPTGSVSELFSHLFITSDVTMPAPFAEWLGSEAIALLNGQGFINLEPLSKAQNIDADFAADQTHRAAAKHALHVGLGEPLSIHPVFREDRWTGLSGTDYDDIRPALLLASRILDDAAVLPYFKGLFREDTWTEIDTQGKFEEPRYSFRAVPIEKSHDGKSFDITEQKQMWLRLAEMKKCVRWRFGGNHGESYGETTATDTLPGLVEGSYGSLVYLNQQYLDILTGKTTMSDVAEVWTPGSDAASGMLRSHLLLATVLLHEFCHALRNASVAHVSYVIGTEPDPYYGDHRKAELGHAFEQKILSGTIASIYDGMELTAPYGLSICRWPNLIPAHEWEEQLASATQWGENWITEYPVSMDWVLSLFTRRFWDHDMMTHGLKALKPPRKIGFRWRTTDDGDEDLDMRIKAPGSPDSIVSEEGDENEHRIVVRT